ncbi:MAG: 6-phosphogluconolactonase [Bacteroidetes bacterium]|nr:6-phosphogluconolactonase [Bacteroidota bacterium]MDA1269500.1 6-phosphogluconolactonase [Bacteroidota bacterium]
MNFHFFSDFESISTLGFELIKEEIKKKPNLLFCVASGGSPSGAYAKLIAYKQQHTEFGAQLRVIKLDEWGGLEPGSPFTSELDVQQKFVQPMGITADCYWTIDPTTTDPEGACLRMERVLEQEGPLDICILGIGVNGHIALNEPREEHQLPYHVCELAESTLANGMLKTLKQPPSFGMTIGLRGIMQSKLILLFIAGSGKKEAFERLKEPKVSGQFPASFLWLHPNVQVLIDQRAI